MSRFVNNRKLAATENSIAGHGCTIYMRKGAERTELGSALYDWEGDMSNSRRCIFGVIIQAKAQQLAGEINDRLTSDVQITKQFLEGWLERFKKRWGLKAFRLLGEAGDIDLSNSVMATDDVRIKIETYHLKDVFNRDESELFYQVAQDCTIASSAFSGRKYQKARSTFLACCNADDTEKIPLMIIGTASKPRCFEKETDMELVPYYRNDKMAWINYSIFFEWLRYIYDTIGKNSGRTILLLMDNCSANGTIETLPQLNHVKVAFLSANTTSKLQPLDDSIIAAMKVRYRRRLMERAVDLLDIADMDIYKIHVVTAMRWLTNIWDALSADKIWNCWGATEIVPAYDTVEPTPDLDATDDDEEALEHYVQISVAIASRRISVGELISRDDAIECTQVYSDVDIVHNIVSAKTEQN